MSRIPQPSSSYSRTPAKPSPALTVPTRTRAKTSSSSSPTPSPTLRTQRSVKSLKPSRSPVPPKSPVRRTVPVPDEPPVPKLQLSIKEQIALKRAELKKAAEHGGANAGDTSLDFAGLEDADPTAAKRNAEEDNVDLGRWSVKETIERARSTGAINLASRALPCLPSALFEIHLGVKVDPLKSVPQEPPITTTSSLDDTAATRRRGAHSNTPSWYEAQDLEVLKAWSNEIVEIQPELSMFGSLKIVDLHNNKLIALPDSFADLTALTVLDLSYNALTCLPVNLFALPNLTALNISHNALTSLPFRAPFDVPGSNPLARTKDSRGDWFSQSITRATAPLPRLTTLDASHNHLAASAIDHAPRSTSLPAQLTKLDLSANPLGLCVTFIRALSSLERLRELRIQRAEIADDSFPIDLFTSETEQPFPALRVFDLEETHVSRPAMEGAFSRSSLKQELEFDVTTEEPHEGVLRIVLGKRVTKEAWEVEAERRAKLRRTQQGVAVQEEGLDIGRRGGSGRVSGYGEVVKEAWEIEAEQGLLTEGAKRRARAAAAAAQSSSVPFSPTPASPHKKQPVEKEAWELEAERGMLTAGAQRRARAAAVATAESISSTKRQGPSASNSPPPTVPPSPSTTAAALSHPRFYSTATQTLTLPTSTPPSKAPHTRSFSLAAPSWVGSVSPSSGSADLTLAVPTPTLPLAAIATLPSAHTLKVLTLANRRKDPSFSLPSAPEGFTLPNLEELSLEGCNLAGSVPVSYASASVDGSELTTPRISELLLPLLARLFPNLSILDLSFNSLDSAALTKDALISLILATVVEQESEASHVRKGLRHLRLRGNRITELDGFQGIAELFKGNRDVPGWKLEELDLRDNEIGKLPAELGLLPLDVFLVDGNVFRVPARRVWEREGTKGLLSWLRGRIE